LVVLLLPLQHLIEIHIGNRSCFAALIVTLGVLILFVSAIAPLSRKLASEIVLVAQSLKNLGEYETEKFFTWLASIPIVGPKLLPYLKQASEGDISSLVELLELYRGSYLSYASRALIGAASSLVTIHHVFRS